MKVKKDLEFTPPLEEYALPGKESNHVPKDEFHQKTSPEPEAVQGRKGWKRKLRHMLTAGAAVVVVTTAMGSVSEKQQDEWIEFDIEIDGTQFHLPCDISEALDFAEREGHPLERQKEGLFTNDIGLHIYTKINEDADTNEGAVRDSWWDSVRLDLGKGDLSFNYEGITGDSTWDDCFSALNIPDNYVIWESTDDYLYTWFSKKLAERKYSPSVNIRFYNDRIDGVSIGEEEIPWAWYVTKVEIPWDGVVQKKEMTAKEDSEKWLSIHYECDSNISPDSPNMFLDGIYVFDTNVLPMKFEDLPSENLLGDNGIKFEDNRWVYENLVLNTTKFEDTIWMPKPEYENWSIALVYRCCYGYHGDFGDPGTEFMFYKRAEIFTYADEILSAPGGHIEICRRGNSSYFDLILEPPTSEE